MGCEPHLDSFGPNGVVFPHSSCNMGGGGGGDISCEGQRCYEKGSEKHCVGAEMKHIWLFGGGYTQTIMHDNKTQTQTHTCWLKTRCTNTRFVWVMQNIWNQFDATTPPSSNLSPHQLW